MIFIIGGAYQGKTEYAKQKYPDYVIVNHHHLIVEEQLQQGLDSGEELDKFFSKHLEKHGNLNNLVVISDELGYGIVPVNQFDRKLRETNGRINCRLAEVADEVIRVVCGVGKRIK